MSSGRQTQPYSQKPHTFFREIYDHWQHQQQQNAAEWLPLTASTDDGVSRHDHKMSPLKYQLLIFTFVLMAVTRFRRRDLLLCPTRSRLASLSKRSLKGSDDTTDRSGMFTLEPIHMPRRAVYPIKIVWRHSLGGTIHLEKLILSYSILRVISRADIEGFEKNNIETVHLSVTESGLTFR